MSLQLLNSIQPGKQVSWKRSTIGDGMYFELSQGSFTYIVSTYREIAKLARGLRIETISNYSGRSASKTAARQFLDKIENKEITVDPRYTLSKSSKDTTLLLAREKSAVKNMGTQLRTPNAREDYRKQAKDGKYQLKYGIKKGETIRLNQIDSSLGSERAAFLQSRTLNSCHVLRDQFINDKMIKGVIGKKHPKLNSKNLRYFMHKEAPCFLGIHEWHIMGLTPKEVKAARSIDDKDIANSPLSAAYQFVDGVYSPGEAGSKPLNYLARELAKKLFVS